LCPQRIQRRDFENAIATKTEDLLAIAQLSSTGKPVDFCFRIVVQKSDEIRRFWS